MSSIGNASSAKARRAQLPRRLESESTNPRKAARSAALKFRSFSEQLYCSGAEAGICAPFGSQSFSAGECYWHKQVSDGKWVPVNAAEVVDSTVDNGKMKARFKYDRWDPLLFPDVAGTGYRYFGREEAARCLRHKHIMVAGDSTARDTFYTLMNVAGRPIMHGIMNDSRKYWGGYSPATPDSSGGQDVFGRCMGDHTHQKTCIRDLRFPERGGEDTRFTFHFLTQSNSTWETSTASEVLSKHAPNAAFVACPFYEWFRPDAYNYNLTREQRARQSNKVGPQHLEAIGKSCSDYMDRVIVRPHGLKTRLFTLGPPPLPGWTRDAAGVDVEKKIFRSIHKGLGLRCEKSDDAGGYELLSTRGITPIDRYAVVGARRRDAVHPYFNAQFAIVQLMLNHLCPLGGTTTAFGT
uniref:Uncharacterized protein n=1 Tax=Chrysotila carterae TaxID=13221 RepID=A0A7S4BGA5_CHRCT|mmetsp:Transcript_4268/g.9301  ORF Transcript_4268/g.9301 Transcript_4268/m.9301 type:complete len:409 (+) Transcript_4268:255-1481(+)